MVLAAVLTTVALGILLRGAVVLIWSAQGQIPGQAARAGEQRRSQSSGGARISLFAADLLIATATVYGGLFCSCGLAAGACGCAPPGKNPLLAAQRGIDLHAIYALAWGLATLTGSLAGMLIALDFGLAAPWSSSA